MAGQIHGYVSRDLAWVRFGKTPGRGFQVKRTPPLFSERHGYQKFHRLPFGWRWRVLT